MFTGGGLACYKIDWIDVNQRNDPDCIRHQICLMQFAVAPAWPAFRLFPFCTMGPVDAAPSLANALMPTRAPVQCASNRTAC